MQNKKKYMFYEGKKTGQAKFYSPSKKRVTPKGCLMVKRSLFQTKVLAALDRGQCDINSVQDIGKG